jgi:hypothetical protein
METLLMATIIRKTDRAKYKKYFSTNNGDIIGYISTCGESREN